MGRVPHADRPLHAVPDNSPSRETLQSTRWVAQPTRERVVEEVMKVEEAVEAVIRGMVKGEP